MQYYSDINPFYEAFVYLTDRLADNRTCDRILSLEPADSMMRDDYWAKFACIMELQQELDSAIPVDELMERYFKPYCVSEQLPQGRHLSLGYVLLGRPAGLAGDYSLDGLVDYYRSAPLGTILAHFYDKIATTFFTEPDETCSNLNDFMVFLDGVFVNTQDKWDILDAATDPEKHIKRLSRLVRSVEKLISERSVDYKELIEHERMMFLSSKPTEVETVNSIGFNFKNEDVEGIHIIPSLLSFNGVNYATDKQNGIYIQLGISFCTVVQLRSKKNNTKTYLNLLKLLADETRFNALHDMRNRYSYGQELAEKLKCTRNTMYYHLEKMMGLGLIRCRETEYRMLYTMDKKTVYEKLTSLRDYLTDGWKPGDPEQEPELPE